MEKKTTFIFYFIPLASLEFLEFFSPVSTCYFKFSQLRVHFVFKLLDKVRTIRAIVLAPNEAGYRGQG